MKVNIPSIRGLIGSNFKFQLQCRPQLQCQFAQITYKRGNIFRFLEIIEIAIGIAIEFFYQFLRTNHPYLHPCTSMMLMNDVEIVRFFSIP